jgi:hypothetical protein
MNIHHQIPPSINDLQIYLIQLQEILRRRQDAAAQHEIVKMQLLSVDAQAQRENELERTRLKAEADQAIAQETIRARLESDRIRQEAEIRKAQLAAESENSRKQTILESARIGAEALKSARMETIREQSRRQAESARESYILELNAASHELQSYLLTHKEVLDHFPKLQQEISGYLKERDKEQALLAGLRIVRENIGLLPRFLDLVSILKQAGLPASDAISLIQPSSFAVLKAELATQTLNVDSIPAVGFANWQPVDNAGRDMPPWVDSHAVPIWKERGTSVIWAIFQNQCYFHNDLNSTTATEIILRFNSTEIGARKNWAIPSIDELRRFSKFETLNILNADKIRRVWAAFSSAPGRLSSFSFIDGKRETTGEKDKCSLLLISNC